MPVQDDQISGTPYRQRAHQNRIHEAENSRVRADAQCKRQHGHRGE